MVRENKLIIAKIKMRNIKSSTNEYMIFTFQASSGKSPTHQNTAERFTLDPRFIYLIYNFINLRQNNSIIIPKTPYRSHSTKKKQI